MIQASPFQRINKLTEVADKRPTYLAVGVFDGVHLGHQKLIGEMVRAARTGGVRPAVLTFHPHPKEIILGSSGRLYLTTLAERVSLLANLGVELIITHPFNEQVRLIPASEFVTALCQNLALRQLWGGHFSLGYQREGDAAFLSTMGAEMGYSVHELNELVTWNNERVSSSRVRRSLAAGDIGDVNGCLGRFFSLVGEVVRGDQRGRTIGFPTANLDIWDQQLLPANGVYAAYAQLGEERFLAATNVGVRPTIAGDHLTVEAHLLDFDRDIYGETLRLQFLQRVRSERKFPNLDALKAQIAADVALVRHILD